MRMCKGSVGREKSLLGTIGTYRRMSEPYGPMSEPHIRQPLQLNPIMSIGPSASRQHNILANINPIFEHAPTWRYCQKGAFNSHKQCDIRSPTHKQLYHGKHKDDPIPSQRCLPSDHVFVRRITAFAYNRKIAKMTMRGRQTPAATWIMYARLGGLATVAEASLGSISKSLNFSMLDQECQNV